MRTRLRDLEARGDQSLSDEHGVVGKVALPKGGLRVAATSIETISRILHLMHAVLLVRESLEVNLDLRLLCTPHLGHNLRYPVSVMSIARLGRAGGLTNASSSHARVFSMNSAGHPLAVDDELVPGSANVDLGDLMMLGCLDRDGRLGGSVVCGCNG